MMLSFITENVNTRLGGTIDAHFSTALEICEMSLRS